MSSAFGSAASDQSIQPAGHRRICILGGGCIGLSTALALSERVRQYTTRSSRGDIRLSITIVADSLPPHTTSNVAAGLCRPFGLSSGMDADVLKRWTISTRKWLEKHSSLATAPDLGLFPMFIVEGSDEHDAPADWVREMNGFRMLEGEAKSALGMTAPSCWTWQTLIVQSGLYLDWLAQQCVQKGVRFVTKKVAQLDELAEFDLVVNCTGLMSHSLFKDDNVVAVRGQIMRVRAPWIKHTTLVNSGGKFTYIIPNKDMVVIGGTMQEGNWSTAVDPKDSVDIWTRCCALVPSLKNATVLEELAGLRPSRKGGVRIELEHTRLSDGRMLPVVHNYGHGGSGFTVHWGCAEDAVALVMPALRLPAVAKL